jgi:hypothetical protein
MPGNLIKHQLMNGNFSIFAIVILMVFASFFSACTQPTVKRYASLLDRKVNISKKSEMDQVLGEPVSCKQERAFQKCEYRTAQARNYPVPAIYEKQNAMGPDISPYEYFDVLHLFYDHEGILREWEPIVMRP